MSIKDFFKNPGTAFNYVLSFNTDKEIDYSLIKYSGTRWNKSNDKLVKFYSDKSKSELESIIIKELSVSREDFNLFNTSEYAAMRF